MIILIWMLLVNPILQTEQLLDVFLNAFLPQERLSTEELSDYFYTKITPRLAEKQHVMTVWDQVEPLSPKGERFLLQRFLQ